MRIFCVDELLLDVMKGDECAFRQLYARHSSKLASHIFGITKSKEIVAEIVQDVFIKVWQNREQLGEIKNFDGYLYVLAKNQALNELKKQIKERVLQNAWLSENVNENGFQEEPCPSYQLLDQAIDKLPTQQKLVYTLSRHRRLKYKEIADELNLSRETVKKYLQKATTSISQYLYNQKENIVSLLGFLIFFKSR